MLTRSMNKAPAAQKGVVLMIALIVLVAMTLAGLALVRSVDTGNIIAGNMAFQQAATQSADTGVETAVTWLQTVAAANIATLNNDDATNGYAAAGLGFNPIAGQSWDAYWNLALAARAKTLSADGAGNTVSYVIDRLCALALSPTGGGRCTSSPLVSAATGNSEESGELAMASNSLVYYRITARVAGPRNTVSYVQSIVAM